MRWVKPPSGSGRERVEYEADPRLAELIIQEVKTGVEHSTVLNSADHTVHWSGTMRLCYLALNRPGLPFPSKEVARWMQAPTVGNLEALKRVTRYLIGHGRLIQEFVRQIEEPSHIVVCADSDHAGCLSSRLKYFIINIVLWCPTCYPPFQPNGR